LGNGVLLPVDGSVLECRKEFAESHGSGIAAEGLHHFEVHFAFRNADFKALEVFGGFDGVLVVGGVTETVFPYADAGITEIFAFREDFLSQFAVKNTIGMFCILENIGKVN